MLLDHIVKFIVCVRQKMTPNSVGKKLGQQCFLGGKQHQLLVPLHESKNEVGKETASTSS